MKRIVKQSGMAACMLAVCMLTACSVDDTDNYVDLRDMNYVGDRMNVYDGEWTTDRLVVDTARLEVSSWLKVRLPEVALTYLCFEKELVSSAMPVTFAYKNQPSVLTFSEQGYTDEAVFYTVASADKPYDGSLPSNISASFIVAVNGVDHRVELLSTDNGSAVYRGSTDLWTIAITVERFLVTNLDTQEQFVRSVPKPVTIYYNTKKRIW